MSDLTSRYGELELRNAAKRRGVQRNARSEHETGSRGERRALGVGELVVKQEIGVLDRSIPGPGRGGTANTLAGHPTMPTGQVGSRLAVSARQPRFPCRCARRVRLLDARWLALNQMHL